MDGKRRQLTQLQRLGLTVALTLAGIVALFIIVDQAILPALTRASDERTMPSLVGLPLDQAKQRIAELHLTVSDVREQFSANIAEGRVMSQMPYVGAVVKEGRRVYLTISSGEETLTMPSLVGMSLRDARIALMRVGLGMGNIAYEASDSVQNGNVLSQSQAPRSLVAYGTLVSVVVSSGPRGLPVPDVQGQPLDVAVEMLTSSGLLLGRVSTVPSGLFEANTVVRQLQRDTVLPMGSKIDLEVAR